MTATYDQVRKAEAGGNTFKQAEAELQYDQLCQRIAEKYRR